MVNKATLPQSSLQLELKTPCLCGSCRANKCRKGGKILGLPSSFQFSKLKLSGSHSYEYIHLSCKRREKKNLRPVPALEKKNYRPVPASKKTTTGPFCPSKKILPARPGNLFWEKTTGPARPGKNSPTIFCRFIRFRQTRIL